MSSSHALHALLTELLGNQYIEVTVGSGQDIGEVIEDAIATARAEHMKTCDSCRAEHEAELKKKADDEMAQSKVGAQETAAGDTRVPVGYVAFVDHPDKKLRIVGNSFSVSKEDVEAKLKLFIQASFVGQMVEMGLIKVGVKPLYL